LYLKRPKGELKRKKGVKENILHFFRRKFCKTENCFYLCAQLPYLRILDRQASPVGAFLLYFLFFAPFMERVSFYVDGFNFYHGLKRLKIADCDWQKFYWLDFVKFFQHFIGENQVL